MTAFTERRWTSPDGLALYARDYPGLSGPAKLPVIALHGLTRNSRDFEDVAPPMAGSGRRVLAPDVRGRGFSAWDAPTAYQPATYAADVQALVRQAGISRAVFIGTSMGGLITMALAAGAPDLVAAAVINDVGPVLGPAGLTRIAGYAGGGAPVETWADAAGYAQRINGAAFPDAEPAFWDAFARRLFREDAAGRPVLDYDPGIAEALRSAPQPAPDLWPLWDRLAAGRRPLLLVRGENSDLLQRETADEMARRAPNLHRVEAPRVGHAPMLTEAPVAAALRAFLAEVD